MNRENNNIICLLGDFGVGKTLENTLMIANTITGTPAFMSPEIV